MHTAQMSMAYFWILTDIYTVISLWKHWAFRLLTWYIIGITCSLLKEPFCYLKAQILTNLLEIIGEVAVNTHAWQSLQRVTVWCHPSWNPPLGRVQHPQWPESETHLICLSWWTSSISHGLGKLRQMTKCSCAQPSIKNPQLEMKQNVG